MGISFPWNSVSGDKKYSADEFRMPFKALLGNGVFPFQNSNFNVISYSGMKVKVQSGVACIDGVFFSETEEQIITIDLGDPLLNRIDRIVLQKVESDRSFSIRIKKGNPASNAVPPELIRNSDVYELCLAEIYVGQGATSIRYADITDTRLNKNLCGFVINKVEGIDTTTLFNQIEDIKNIKLTNLEQDIATWFNNFKSNLGNDAATNLSAKITDLTVQVNSMYNVKANKDYVDTEVAKVNKALEDYKKEIGKRTISNDTFIRETDLGDGTVLVNVLTASGAVPQNGVVYWSANYSGRYKEVCGHPIPASTNRGNSASYTSGNAVCETYDKDYASGYVENCKPYKYTFITLLFVAVRK